MLTKTAKDTQSVSTHISTGQRYCQALIEKMVHETSSVVFAALSTVDGNSFAFKSKNEAIIDSRIAAMTSSLLALSESLSKEGLNGQCSYNTISTDYGSIVTVRVPTDKKLHTFSLCTDRTDSMAMSMRLSFDTAEKLAQIIEYP